MQNPRTVQIVVGVSPVLVFSGCGNVRFQDFGSPRAVFGDDEVSAADGVASNAHTFTLDPGNPLEFKADAKVFAVRPAGAAPAVVQVTRWF